LSKERRRAVRTWIAALALALFSSPAFADITAVYEAANFKMTVEIASNGDMRSAVTAKPGEYAIIKGGETYIVLTTPAGVVVDRTADVMAIVGDVMEKMQPGYRALMAFALDKKAGTTELEAGQDVTVRGRVGTPYYFKGRESLPSSVPVVVISRDPALRLLRDALKHQMEMSNQLMGAAMGVTKPFEDPMIDVLREGAPLKFAGAELASVEDAPIAASRFDLPSTPETREAIRKRIEATATSNVVVGF
jgi:hypothetical protein